MLKIQPNFKLNTLLLAFILFIPIVLASFTLAPAYVNAAPKDDIVTCDPKTDSGCTCSSQGCTDSTPGSDLGNGCAGAKSGEECLEDNPLVEKIQIVVNFLSAGVGLVIIIGVLAGGIKYISAGDNPQQVQSAKDMIRNAIFALIVFALLFSFLQWLVPGGVF